MSATAHKRRDRPRGQAMTIHEYLDEFTDAYAECMLWANTTCEHDDNPDDSHEVDPAWWQEPREHWRLRAFDVASQDSIREDCRAFVGSQWRDLHTLDPAQSAHDFALTRNGHGTGFWDRGYGERGERLSQACKPFGSSTAFTTEDDSEVHLY